MFNYREAVHADVEPIIRVMQDTGYTKFVCPGKSLGELKRAVTEEVQGMTYLVCEEKETKKIVGYFIMDAVGKHLSDVPDALEIDSGYAYNLGVGILSDYRGKGLATELTKRALETAKRKGFKGIYAAIGSTNAVSIKLHEKCGFRELIRYDADWRGKGIKNVIFGRGL